MPVKKLFLLLSVILFLIFIYFSYLVAKERFTHFDFDTTVRLQDHISRRYDLPFSTLSLVGSAEITTIIWFCLLVFIFLKRFFLAAIGLLFFLASAPIELFGKLFVYHPGPPFLFYRGVVNINFPSQYLDTNYSYPSGHMTRASFLITFLILYLYFRSKSSSKILIQISLVIFLALMAISRVYLGEHWTSDVIGGTLIGISLGIVAGIALPVKKLASDN